jgi:hypothetical protein
VAPHIVRDNVGFALLRDRHPCTEIRAREREITGLLPIGDILDGHLPTVCQQPRTSLARALIRRGGVDAIGSEIVVMLRTAALDLSEREMARALFDRASAAVLSWPAS